MSVRLLQEKPTKRPLLYCCGICWRVGETITLCARDVIIIFHVTRTRDFQKKNRSYLCTVKAENDIHFGLACTVTDANPIENV